MSSLQTVFKLLPALSAKELVEVRQRLDLLAPKKPSTGVDDWLLLGLTKELQKRGLLSGCYYGPIMPKDYAVKADEARTFLLKGYVNDKPATVERLALGQLAGFVLAEYLPKLKIPLGPKTLLINIDKIPVALEESFPGYWASRALGLCIGR